MGVLRKGRQEHWSQRRTRGWRHVIAGLLAFKAGGRQEPKPAGRAPGNGNSKDAILPQRLQEEPKLPIP